jgi:hypothetical protein
MKIYESWSLDNGIDFIDLGSQYKTFTDRTEN